MERLISILLILLFVGVGYDALAGSEFMSDTMDNCDNKTTKTDFSLYVECIKDMYNLEGVMPSDPSIKRFYYRLDDLSERYKRKELTQLQAMSAAYDAYELIVGTTDRAQQQARQEKIEKQQMRLEQQQERQRQGLSQGIQQILRQQQQLQQQQQQELQQMIRPTYQQPLLNPSPSFKCRSYGIGNNVYTDCQ